jgi:hypothetical protein
LACGCLRSNERVMPHPTQVVSGPEVTGNDGSDHVGGDRSPAEHGIEATVLLRSSERAKDELRHAARPFDNTP